MAYHHNSAFYKNKTRVRKFNKIALITLSALLIASVIIGYDWIRNQMSNTNTIVSRENNTSVQSANVSVYRTEYFQFQASEQWVALASQTTDKRFTFVKKNRSLVSSRIVVYVDRPAAELDSDYKITNVLPVEIGPNNDLVNIGEVSNHCSTSWPEGLLKNPTRITHKEVSFVCAPDSNQYNVVVGGRGDTEQLRMKRNDGSEATYLIIYSDLTAYPGTGDIYEVISSFQAL